MVNARHLRVGFFEDAPVVFVERDEKNQLVFKGYAIEFLKWVAADLNFTYELLEIDYTDGFAGLWKEFSNKGLHLGLPLYGGKEGRSKIMTPLFPVDFSYNTLIIPYPKRESDPWSFVKPYSYPVWILVLVSMISFAFILKLVAIRNWSESIKNSTKNNPDEVTPIYLIGVLLNQGMIGCRCLNNGSCQICRQCQFSNFGEQRS